MHANKVKILLFDPADQIRIKKRYVNVCLTQFPDSIPLDSAIGVQHSDVDVRHSAFNYPLGARLLLRTSERAGLKSCKESSVLSIDFRILFAAEQAELGMFAWSSLASKAFRK